MTTVTSTETITITETDGTVVEVSGPRGPQGATGAVGAAGADADVSALLVKASNLSDLASASSARTNLGLGTMATATATDYLTKAGNLTGLADLPTARTNLGLGTAAVANTGTGASNVILGNDARLTDTRTPSAASIVDAMISSTLSPSKITGTAAILGANTFTAQQFIDGSADQIQLRVQGHSTQTADFLTVENSAGTKLGGWDKYGQLNTQYVTDTTGVSPYLRFQTTSMVAINQGNVANTVFAVRGMASQSGALTIWQDSASTTLARIGSTGAMEVSAGGSIFGSLGPGFSNNTVGILPTATAHTGLRVHGLVSQTGDLQTWTNSSTTVLASVSAAGLGTFAGVTSTALVTTPASTTGSAGLNIPHGAAPTSPVNGDVWTTTTAVFARINSATKTLATTADVDLKAPLSLTLNQQTASYSLVLADAGKLVEISNASANTLTVPLNSSQAFPVGTQITFVQTGAGQTTIAPDGGVTINGTPTLKLRAQWSSVTLIKRATDTWLAVGDLAAS